MARTVFVTGGTGYVGGRLIPRLLARGHRVSALARPGSAAKVPAGCDAVIGDLIERDEPEPLRAVSRRRQPLQLVGALVAAVEAPAASRVIEVPEIRTLERKGR